MKETFEEVVVPDTHGFGSFNKIMVKLVGNKFEELFQFSQRKPTVSMKESKLPDANGYWNIHGREHQIFYKKELIALLHTEDCGLGTAKARAFLTDRGFKIA